jgi:small-conductance mechanosensitive channel
MEDVLHDLYQAISTALPRRLRGYLDPALVLLAAVAVGALVRLTLFRWLRRLAAANAIAYDDIIVDGLSKRVIPWVALITVLLQIEELPWRPRSIALAQDIVAALLIASLTLTLVRIVSRIAGAYAQTTAAGVGGTTLIRYIATVCLVLIGGVAVLALFGVSVVPAITALGVGGLAVALAFQDTLANVFSGINLTLARQIRVGDYVDIAPQLGGYVTDIGWRATTLRTPSGPRVHIPNKKLAEAVMTNYSYPEARTAIEINFSVGHDADPEKVEAAVVAEIADATQALAGVRRDEPATVRFVDIGENALLFRATVPIANFEERGLLRHALLKRLVRRLREEGLSIPRPQREVRLAGSPPLGG